jgi:hypothetical protein
MVPQNNSELQALPRYQGNVEEHRRILGFGRAVIRKLSADPLVKDVARPTLYHPDLHKRNIFVAEEDPTTITAIIDWQASAIEPAFWYADEVPDFARPVPHPSLADQFEPDSARCAKVFSLRTQYLVPTLARPRLMDESPFRPYRYCYRTWKDGIVAFRHELIQTAQCWEQLGLAGACPYPLPSSEELAIHQEEYQRFTAAHELKSTLSSLLNTATDGWVPPDEFESARIGEKEMFDGILEAVLNDEDPDDDEPIRTEKDLKEIWPFDLGQQSLAAA